MATLNTESPFQSWIMTDAELLQGQMLTITQKQCIQNQIASLAIERVNLPIDPVNILATIQADADKKGQILALQYLLTLSAQAEELYQNGSNANPQE
jgi:hypothetical protein